MRTLFDCCYAVKFHPLSAPHLKSGGKVEEVQCQHTLLLASVGLASSKGNLKHKDLPFNRGSFKFLYKCRNQMRRMNPAVAVGDMQRGSETSVSGVAA